MSVDLLTEAEPSRLASGALAVLAGTDLQTAATAHGLNLVELSEAVQAYMAAGYAALERRTEQRWRQIFVEFPDWEQAETVAAAQLGPRLDELHHHGVIAGWWFLRKQPCWRLRLRSPVTADPSPDAVDHITGVLTELTEIRAIEQWRPAIYEPEYAAFGGSAAMPIVHELFCADSRGVLAYAREGAPDIGRRELSIVLLHALLHGAGLDWFEMGDVLDRVARLRPPPPPTALNTAEGLTGSVRALVHMAAQDPHLPLTLKGPSVPVTAWRDAFHTAGRRLDAAAARGRLDRGLRAVLSHVVIFHWNRLGLSATTQGILARAAAAAFLPAT